MRDKTPSLGDSSSNSPDNASLSSSSKMPPNHSRGVPRSLWDATGHGFIEEFGEYASRFIASPDNTGTGASLIGKVLRGVPSGRISDFLGLQTFFLAAPASRSRRSTSYGSESLYAVVSDIHSNGTGTRTSFSYGAFNCASFPFSSYREAGASLQKKILAVSLNPCQLHLQRSTRTHSKCSIGGFLIFVLTFRILPNRSHILFFDNVFSIILTLITVIISILTFSKRKEMKRILNTYVPFLFAPFSFPCCLARFPIIKLK